MSSYKRCVIVGGAEIKNYARIKNLLQKDDYFIFCDSGLNHINNLNIRPNLIVGDFDSFFNELPKIETIHLPYKKDDTDSFFATKEGIKRGFSNFLLLGLIGQRFDHSLGNISILYMLNSKNKQAILVDDYSTMEIVSSKPAYVDNTYSYFSIINIDGSAKGIYVENAMYPLDNAILEWDYQYAISNQPLKNETSKIYTKEGRLLLIKVF